MSLPFVSIIIPVYSFQNCLADCIESLSKQTYPKDRFEIMVVYNSLEKEFDQDPDKIKTLLSHVPAKIATRYIREYKFGTYSARNKGVHEAQGSVIAFTDSDCLPDKDWLKNGVQKIKQSVTLSVIVGRVIIFPRDHVHSNLLERYELLYALKQRTYVKRGFFGATANIMLQKEIFSKVGYFDEDLPSAGDKDWCWRAVMAGCPLVFAPEAVIFHPAIYQLRDMIRRQRRMAGGHYDFEKKWKGKPHPPENKLKKGFRYPGVQLTALSALHYLIRMVIIFERIRCRLMNIRIRG